MTEELNIFKKTEEILNFITADSIVNNMPKMWKHHLYPHMVDAVLEMHSLVHHANTMVEERADYLKKYLGTMERLKSLARVAHERRALTHLQMAMLQEMTESAGKQATAWRKKYMADKKKEQKQQ